MFAILTEVGRLGFSLVTRILGFHLFRLDIGSLGYDGLQIVIESLGWRFVAGMATAFYFTHDGFRAGIDEAIASLF